MNAQNTQNLQNCLQFEVSFPCDSAVERLLAPIAKLTNGVKDYYANRTLTNFLTRMSPKLLRDSGLDDPRVQMRLFESNFNTEADLRELNRNRYLIR
jgi:hypothetical protein